jgi:thiol peroxidase
MPSVTLKGNAVKLAEGEIKVGQTAPDFTTQKTDLSDYALSGSRGKTRVLLSVPSVDTPVCDAETRRFNEEASKLPDVEVVSISMDLPFALKRWCGAASVEKVVTTSDHRNGLFGKSYGVLIQGGPLDRCLARAVFVVGPDNKVKHVEYVKEITEHPNYDNALRAARG